MRISGGRSKSRVSLGVRRISLLRPCCWNASSQSAFISSTSSTPIRGVMVISSRVSNSKTSPGVHLAGPLERLAHDLVVVRLDVGERGRLTSMGGRVKLSSG